MSTVKGLSERQKLRKQRGEEAAKAVELNKKAKRSVLALAMALHPRLGAASPARHLSSNILEHIAQCLVPRLCNLEIATTRITLLPSGAFPMPMLSEACRSRAQQLLKPQALQKAQDGLNSGSQYSSYAETYTADNTSVSMLSSQQVQEMFVQVRLRADAPFGQSTPPECILSSPVALDVTVVYEDGSQLEMNGDEEPVLLGDVKGVECPHNGDPMKLRLRMGRRTALPAQDCDEGCESANTPTPHVSV